jgi:hypothetical protein
MTDTLPAPPYAMDLIAELTPYTLTNDEAQAARTAFNWALRTRFTDMHAAMCDLPVPALRDVLLAVDVLGSTLRFELAGREFDRSLISPSRVLDGSDRSPVPVGVEGWSINGRSE